MNCVYIGVYVKVLIRFLPFLWIFSLRGRIEKTEASRRIVAAFYNPFQTLSAHLTTRNVLRCRCEERVAN